MATRVETALTDLCFFKVADILFLAHRGLRPLYYPGALPSLYGPNVGVVPSCTIAAGGPWKFSGLCPSWMLSVGDRGLRRQAYDAGP